MTERKIGLYGGTFNPIHNGHINLALQLKEHHHLDEVWFCPTRISPHRQDEPVVAGELRLEMIKLAIGEIPGFKVIDLEIQRDGPSYTIDTLRQLDQPLYLILADEVAATLHRWKEAEEIIRLAPLLVGRRHLDGAIPVTGHPVIDHAINKGYTNTTVVQTSATVIRDRLASNLYCGHLTHPAVAQYAIRRNLYSR